jgi:hypothetical protein
MKKRGRTRARDWRKVMALYASGVKKYAIAKRLGYSRQLVGYIVKRSTMEVSA